MSKLFKIESHKTNSYIAVTAKAGFPFMGQGRREVLKSGGGGGTVF